MVCMKSFQIDFYWCCMYYNPPSSIQLQVFAAMLTCKGKTTPDTAESDQSIMEHLREVINRIDELLFRTHAENGFPSLSLPLIKV